MMQVCSDRGALHDRSIARVVGDLAPSDLGGYGQAAGVDAEVSLGREATFRASKTLSLSPPFAPAATDFVSWASRLIETKPYKVVALALANKLARVAWAVMVTESSFRTRAA